jgi:ABC-type cobalamin transport system permease subunit
VFLQFVNEAIAQALLHVVFADALEERSLCGVVEEAGIVLGNRVLLEWVENGELLFHNQIILHIF